MAGEDQVPPVEDAPEGPPAPEVPEVVDPPSPTWDDLIGSLGLEPHEIAFKLLQDHGAPSLTARPATFADLVTPSTNQSAQALLLRQSSSSEATFTLVALQNRVAVLHELKELPELNPQGGKYAALRGDIRKVAGQTIFPHLCELQDANSRTAHRAQFATRAVAARPFKCQWPVPP